jgi:unsaturated rhamnogalacturonyl hydrolase
MNRYILIALCGLLSCAGARQQQASKELYSQQMVETRAMKTFITNRKEQQLATAHWDYVPGLVAFSVLKAWEQYPTKTAYYDVVKSYADHCLQGRDTVEVGESNIDDLAAGKIFFTLYKTELAKGNTLDAQRYQHCATFLRNKLKYRHNRIDAARPGAGGFFHKAQYPNQMWLDGLYMGPALYAAWQAGFGEAKGHQDNMDSWSDIALQFKTIHAHTYDKDKQLNYHGWSADTNDPNAFWARKEAPFQGCSPEFWGRGMGWYFAALVDVLELMPASHPDRNALVQIVNEVAAGLARYQDKTTGCWYQLLQYNAGVKGNSQGDGQSGNTYNTCNQSNYIESSASSMFTYAYLKGMRLGLLAKKQYEPVARKAYQGLITQFIRKENNALSIIQSCASAGLGPVKDPSRTGTINYYLCGSDVIITQNEGKAVGPFIMASLEYERFR